MDVPSEPSGPANQPSFLRRHRGSLGVLAALCVLIWLQWPMLKGMYYGVAGAPGPGDGIPWRRDFNAALGEGRQTGRPLLVDFTADWCPPCRVMKHDVWPDGEVRALATDRYIPVLIDVDRYENRGVVQRYGVRSIPTILVLDGQGQILRQTSFISRAAMVEFLQRGLPAATRPAGPAGSPASSSRSS